MEFCSILKFHEIHLNFHLDSVSLDKNLKMHRNHPSINESVTISMHSTMQTFALRTLYLRDKTHCFRSHTSHWNV